MPNYCSNVVTFRHQDPEMIRRVVDGYASDGLFAEFHPIPDRLVNTMAGSYGFDDPRQAELEAQEQANIADFGYKNWYDWAVDNWGTKWDVTQQHNGDAEMSDDQLEVRMSFDTAWSPPVAFYEEMERQGFTVDAFYYEPGMAFCGRYADGLDDYHEIPGTADEAEQVIPREIDEMFAIVESMSMWEQDEESGMGQQANDNETNEESKV